MKIERIYIMIETEDETLEKEWDRLNEGYIADKAKQWLEEQTK